MRILTVNELRRLSNTTLRTLAAQIESVMAALPASSPDHDAAFANLRTIRWVLSQRDLAPH